MPYACGVNILVIGGTRFVGRAIVSSLLSRGHQVTLFHRGQTGADLFPEVTHIHGDRLTDLSLLEGQWDAVIDTCGYFPRAIKLLADRLASRTSFVLFISTISVYEDADGLDEDAARLTLSDESVEVVTGETYGGLKALCEDELLRAWGDRCAIVRPTVVVGPDDYTDRFTYWPAKFTEQEQVLVPDAGETLIQWIDARDLADFCTLLVEQKKGCIVNGAGPFQPVPFSEFIAACASVGTAQPVVRPLTELTAAGVEAWTDLPVLNVESKLFQVSNSRAEELGLKIRPLEETLRDIIAWRKEIGYPALKTGLSAEREAELIK